MRVLTALAVGCAWLGDATVAVAGDDLEALQARVAELSGEGDYAAAVQVAEQAVQLAERRFGENAAETAASLNSLALLCDKLGRHALAEPLYRRLLAILERSCGPDHPDMATSLNNLAGLYVSQGQYDRAEPLFTRALAIDERELGPDHAHTATDLNNLAFVYHNLGRHALAEPLFERALAIKEAVLGPDHPSTVASLENLAACHEAQGRCALAESLFERALAIRERSLGPDHPDTAASVNNLASLRMTQSQYALARPLFERAVAIQERSLGPDHPHTVTSLDNLATCEAFLDRIPAAARFTDRARRGRRRHAARVLPSLSAAEQAAFLQAHDEAELYGALSLGLLRKADPDIVAMSAGWLANGKAVGHEAAAQRIILARRSDDPATAAAMTALEGVRDDLSQLSQQVPAPDEAAAWRGSRDALEAEEHRLIHEIGGQLAALDRDEPWVEVDEIRRSLPADGVLVDIARFETCDFEASVLDHSWGPARYAAWIVPPAGGGEVAIVDLGDAEAIDGLVAEYRRALGSARDDPPAAEPLAARILWPILAALPSGGGTVEELIVSPDGALWLVPWQALPLADGAFAIERYAIRTVTSARDLVPPPTAAAPRDRPSAPLVVADPAFDESPGDAEPPADATAETPAESGGRVLEQVDPLPATRREAEAARAPLERLAGVAPTVRVGREATEAAVRRGAVRPRALVLATHGFFLPDQEVARDERLALAATRGIAGSRPLDASPGEPAEDPLLRCGLLFTGANLPAGDGTVGDDGVLTGAEIVGLDLLGTDLVVLSACETGVGRVNVGEGVAGLRQAFQIAGAKCVVATLWRVPDEESATIMTAFYENLAAGLPAARALRAAQLDFIRRRREAGGPAADHPSAWAAYGVTGR